MKHCQAALKFSCSLGDSLPDVLDGVRGARRVVDLLQLQGLSLAQEGDIEVA